MSLELNIFKYKMTLESKGNTQVTWQKVWFFAWSWG